MRSGQARRGNAIRQRAHRVHDARRVSSGCCCTLGKESFASLGPKCSLLTVQVKKCITFITHLLNRSLNAF